MKSRGAVAPTRTSARGFTLAEVLVVIALISIVTVAVATASNQLPTARLKKSTVSVMSAIRTAFTQASMSSKSLRLAMNFDDGSFAIEQADVPMLVQSKDLVGTGGASAVTEAERRAQDEADRVTRGFTVAKPRFKVVDDLCWGKSDPTKPRTGPCRNLESGVRFREVQTAHDENPIVKGRAYLYFWPGGLTERANIQLNVGAKDEDSSTMTLVVSPLTGSVKLKSGPVVFVRPTDDRSSSEREDTGL